MATANKGLNTPARGSFQNTWDIPNNQNFTFIDSIVAATLPVAFTSSNVALSSSDALNLRYACTGTLGANVILTFPASVGGFWIIDNACTGAFTLSVRSGAGASVVVPQGVCTFVSSDGTTMRYADGAASNGQSSYAVDTGAADAYVVAPPSPVSLKAGASVLWQATNANTGASTLNASGTGATAIKTVAGGDPVAGSIVAGGIYQSTYSGTVWQTINVGFANVGLYSADAGASAGPTLDLYRDSSTPAASDEIGQITFRGEDSGGGVDIYARLFGSIADPTATSEDGRLNIETKIAGASATRGYVGNGLVMGAATGGDQGAGTVNAVELYHGGIPVGALVTLTASASSQLDYTSLVPGIYDIYFNNILPTTNGADLGVRFSVLGSFITTGSYGYQGIAAIGTSITGFGTNTTPTATSILIGSGFGSTAAANMKGNATLIVGGATAAATGINGSYIAAINTGALVLVPFGGENTTSSQIDGIRFFSPSGSTIASGSISIFRRA